MRPMSSQPWYVEAFTADYLDVYPHRDELGATREIQAVLGYLSFDREHHRLLDLASGAGRHSLALRAEQCHVTCLDLSADLTLRSREAGLDTVRADMRKLPFADGSFDAVTMLFSSFGYFDDDADHQATLCDIARVLAPGGSLFLDLMDRDTVSSNLVPEGTERRDDMVIEVQRSMTVGNRRVEKTIAMTRPGGSPRRWLESVRLFTGEEINALAAGAGLAVAGTWGDYEGGPHVAGQSRRLVLLRKPS
ncbi:MAG: SAM-dependent methyltransferase [Pseudohongiellaceae bacterium]|jgi:SAM-dependent methyltransferase